MTNTPVREIPYRTKFQGADGEEFEGVIFLRDADGSLHLRVDDPRAGEDNGKVLVISIIQ